MRHLAIVYKIRIITKIPVDDNNFKLTYLLTYLVYFVWVSDIHYNHTLF